MEEKESTKTIYFENCNKTNKKGINVYAIFNKYKFFIKKNW